MGKIQEPDTLSACPKLFLVIPETDDLGRVPGGIRFIFKGLQSGRAASV